MTKQEIKEKIMKGFEQCVLTSLNEKARCIADVPFIWDKISSAIDTAYEEGQNSQIDLEKLSLVKQEIYQKGLEAGRKQERERMIKKRVAKIDLTGLLLEK